MSQLCRKGRVGILLGAIVVSACDVGAPSGQERADAATQAACRQRAEQAYEQQNRGQIYSPASQVNTPYSNNYLPANTGRGLSDLFTHDRMVNDCVRNTGTDPARASPPN
jgi:hypothetical protein